MGAGLLQPRQRAAVRFALRGLTGNERLLWTALALRPRKLGRPGLPRAPGLRLPARARRLGLALRPSLGGTGPRTRRGCGWPCHRPLARAEPPAGWFTIGGFQPPVTAGALVVGGVSPCGRRQPPALPAILLVRLTALADYSPGAALFPWRWPARAGMAGARLALCDGALSCSTPIRVERGAARLHARRWTVRSRARHLLPDESDSCSWGRWL